jgi:DNA-binding transcriptional LysR family regulator
MELYQLRTFARVAKLGSLTQAAECLHLSQPAASSQIKQLESEFGLALFERRPSGLVLTRAGQSLLPGIEKLLADADQVVTHAKSLSGKVTGPIKFAAVATLSDASLVRIGPMMKLIVQQYPDLNMEVQHRNSRGIYAGVGNGELDAGIALGSVKIPNVRRILLTEVRYRIVAAANRREDMRRVTWIQLASERWISAPKGGSHHQMMVQMFGRRRCQPNKVIEADNELMIDSMVREGIGLGLMQEDWAIAAEQEGRVVIVDKGRPRTFLQFLYSAGRERDPELRAILSVLRQVWSDQNQPSPQSESQPSPKCVATPASAAASLPVPPPAQRF